MITIIVAAAKDGAIGRNGDLLWHLSGDLKRFRLLTTGHAVVMGRKTWESLPKRPLPDRLNVVVTSDSGYDAPCATVAHSLEEALAVASAQSAEVFIIGGASIYRQAADLANAIDLTLVDATYPDADAHFGLPDMALWRVAEESEKLADSKSGLSYRHFTLVKK